MEGQNASLKPDYYERCTFGEMWNYYFMRGKNREILDTFILGAHFNYEGVNPMQAFDIIFVGASSSHRTFIEGVTIEHNTGFFMN